MQGATIEGNYLASFISANLSGARLTHSRDRSLALNVLDSNLDKADVSHTILWPPSSFAGSSVADADFRGADLRGFPKGDNNPDVYIDFRVKLDPKCMPKLEGACFTSATLLPFSREEALKLGMKYHEDRKAPCEPNML